MFEIKLTVDLGDKTISLVNGIIAIAKGAEEAPKANQNAPVIELNVKASPERSAKLSGSSQKEIVSGSTEKDSSWEHLDDDVRLDAIRDQVTKNTSKGKSADVVSLLSHFDAKRASELAPEDYDAFYSAIIRYGRGESIEQIFSE
jgi:hypothetical protein